MISGNKETAGGAGASNFGASTFGAFGAFGAAGAATFGFGGAGIFLGGSIFGIEGAANFSAGAPPAAPSPSSSVSVEAMSLSREMICVYGLGPTGASGKTGAGSLAPGREKAPVAPSPGRALGFATLGAGGIGMTGGIGVTTGGGGGATYAGGENGSFCFEGAANGSTGGGVNALGGGNGVLVVKVRGGASMSLNNPVKLVGEG